MEDLKIKCKKTNQKTTGSKLKNNLINIRFGDIEFNSPFVIPNKKEKKLLDDGDFNGAQPVLEFNKLFLDKFSIDSNKTELRRYNNKHKDKSIVLFNLQRKRNTKISSKLAESLVKIQINAGLPLISIFEPDINQSLESFNNNFDSFKKEYPDSLLSPVIDLSITDTDLFKAKIRTTFNNCKQFNLVCRGFLEYIDRWIWLSNEIATKPIWFNVVGIGSGSHYHADENKKSHLCRAIFFGANTVTLGNRWPVDPKDMNKKKPSVISFNKYNLCFENNSKLTSTQRDLDTVKKFQKLSEEFSRSLDNNKFYKIYSKRKGVNDL